MPRVAALTKLQRTAYYPVHRRSTLSVHGVWDRNKCIDVRRRITRNGYSQFVDGTLGGGVRGLICTILLGRRKRAKMRDGWIKLDILYASINKDRRGKQSREAKNFLKLGSPHTIQGCNATQVQTK